MLFASYYQWKLKDFMKKSINGDLKQNFMSLKVLIATDMIKCWRKPIGKGIIRRKTLIVWLMNLITN